MSAIGRIAITTIGGGLAGAGAGWILRMETDENASKSGARYAAGVGAFGLGQIGTLSQIGYFDGASKLVNGAGYVGTFAGMVAGGLGAYLLTAGD